jgi:hypothetical protein
MRVLSGARTTNHAHHNRIGRPIVFGGFNLFTGWCGYREPIWVSHWRAAAAAVFDQVLDTRVPTECGGDPHSFSTMAS